MRRRDLLAGGMAVGALGWLRPSALEAWVAGRDVARRRLPIPKLIEAVEGEPLTLSMRPGWSEIIAGMATRTWGFNGPLLGPTVRVQSGDDVTIVYRNELAEEVAVHGHGLHVAGELDGGPQRTIAPGESWSPTLPIRQRASTNWYHPHTHGSTGRQVYQGLAGLFLIDDEPSGALSLPSTYGIDDIPIIVQDRSFDRRGGLVYEPDDDEDGFLADTVTVNGIADAMVPVPAGLVRLRVLNGSNARFYRFRFADGRRFHKIATDGGLLQEPVPIQDMIMLPGERNEIVVDFSDGRRAMLVSSNSQFTRESRWSWRDRDSRRDWRDWGPGGLGDAFEILELVPDADLPSTGQRLPRELGPMGRPTPDSSWPVRRFELTMDMDDEHRDHRGHEGRMTMGINGQTMDLHTINERVRLGQWERWRIRSDEGTHPFHIHGCSFLILSQDGRRVREEDAGWKDTVWVEDETELIVRFDHQASREFPYMYHCHILEHEDRGMMGQFTVT